MTEPQPKVPLARFLDKSLLASMLMSAVSDGPHAFEADQIVMLAAQAKAEGVPVRLFIGPHEVLVISFMDRLEKHIDEQIKLRAVELVGDEIRSQLASLGETAQSMEQALRQQMADKLGVSLPERS